VLALTALRREATELSDAGGALWRTDPAGNVLDAPPGALLWPRLLRPDLALGGITGGDMLVAGDPLLRARLRGQVLATGPQTIGGRRFDAVVVELFGDAQRGDASTRLEGAIVIDRASGLLLRLDLRSADPSFTLQRRLLRVEPAAAAPRLRAGIPRGNTSLPAAHGGDTPARHSGFIDNAPAGAGEAR
jgi:hypothetical protein